MRNIFRKAICILLTAAVTAGSLFTVYADEPADSIDILQADNGTSEEEGWATFDPSKTSEWVSEIRGNTYVIHQYKGTATKLKIPGGFNNKGISLEYDTGKGTVFSSSVKELKTDYGVKIVDAHDVFNGSSIVKAEFKGTSFTSDSADYEDWAAFSGHEFIEEVSLYDCVFDYGDLEGNSIFGSFQDFFKDCKKLENVIFYNILILPDSFRYKSMEDMFNGCENLKTVSFIRFYAYYFENFTNMFKGCSKLKTIYVDDHQIIPGGATTAFSGTFDGCTSLVGGKGTVFNSGNSYEDYFRIDEEGSPGYLTFKEDTSETDWDETSKDDWGEEYKDYVSLGGDDCSNYFLNYKGTGTKLRIQGSYFERIMSGRKEYFQTDLVSSYDNETYNIHLRANGPAFPKSVKAIKMDMPIIHDEPMIEPCVLNGNEIKYAEFNYTTFYPYNSKTDHDFFIGNGYIEHVVFNNCNFGSDSDLMENMFKGCSNLKTVVFNCCQLADTVTSLKGMFENCPKLEEVYFNNFNLSTINDVSSMFKNCKSLKRIYVDDSFTVLSENPGFNGDSVFSGCASLSGGLGTSYQSGNDDYQYFRLDEGSTDPGYLTIIKDWNVPYDWNGKRGNLNYKKITNSYDGFGYPSNGSFRIPKARYKAVFGRRGGYLYDMFNDPWGGSCYGLSSTSGLFTVVGNKVDTDKYSAYGTGLEDFSLSGHALDTDPSDDKDSDLDSDLRKLIEALQISQFDERVQAAYAFNTDLNEAVEAVKNEKNPVLIGIFTDEGGHALLAYELSDDDDGINVYDSNHPGEIGKIKLTKTGSD
ncbi:MAG: leucine-rich repeat domain-containing protein, partial [Lachnospiraceae bacterium]|nr:leucine-rich repeat domain-containing protein [Lachnospiraceae bacterium]